MHPSRYLAVLGGIFVVLYALVFFTGPGSIGDVHQKLKPRLGLDLVGGTTLTLIAQTTDGKPPPKTSLEEARNIIEQRVNGLGIAEPEVVTEGNQNIVVSVAGQNSDAIKQVGQPAQLRFRKVINATQDQGPTASPTPKPSASSSGKPKASGSATPSGSVKPSASKTPSATPSASKSAQSSKSPSASSTPSAAASPSTDNTNVGTNKAAQKKLLAKVQKKLGATYQLAQQVTSPDQVAQGGAQAEQALKGFRKLSPAEVSVLPTTMQFNIPQISCKQLNNRPAGSIDNENAQVVSCDSGQKLLLDKAKVLGTDVKSADYTYDNQAGGWKVTLSFKGKGQSKWTNLTKEAYDNSGKTKCEQAALGAEGHCRVAIVLDTKVVSSPQITSVIAGDAEITGGFSQSQATLLANQLKFGALPLTFHQGEANQVSASLGTSQLEAGLIAAAIGLLIVIIYSLFYYRLLGIVIFLSLVLSGLLVFAALILLGRNPGLTLTLAGFAGFVVSLGVAADSFVIYFERLKDEIRDGRSPRSAVPRAWARARRTIISANAITILCAAVLYFLSAGSVKGFAFALGLATILDLIVVFLFRHPIMTLFARSKAFLSPRVSGLGRVLDQQRSEEKPTRRRSGRTETKEA
ncbi:protein translocase subunit SecD [Actinocatenispora thailandica]|nr:protein translocase subunit SecD [Actinocatenispora thailandica]